MHHPTKANWTAMKRILRYLKGAISNGLFVQPSSSPRLILFSDADWVRNKTDRKTTSGFAVYHSSNLISWQSKSSKWWRDPVLILNVNLSQLLLLNFYGYNVSSNCFINQSSYQLYSSVITFWQLT